MPTAFTTPFTDEELVLRASHRHNAMRTRANTPRVKHETRLHRWVDEEEFVWEVRRQ